MNITLKRAGLMLTVLTATLVLAGGPQTGAAQACCITGGEGGLKIKPTLPAPPILPIPCCPELEPVPPTQPAPAELFPEQLPLPTPVEPSLPVLVKPQGPH